MGWNYIGPIDGHDLPTLIATLRNMRDLKGPQFLQAVGVFVFLHDGGGGGCGSRTVGGVGLSVHFGDYSCSLILCPGPVAAAGARRQG